MAPLREREEVESFAEERNSLWLITFAATIWIAHFLVSYAASAVVCAKWAGEGEAAGLMRLGIGAATLLALAGIALVGWRSWRQWDHMEDDDEAQEAPIELVRHRFLGHASFLMSIISFIGVIYVAMPALFMESCL